MSVILVPNQNGFVVSGNTVATSSKSHPMYPRLYHLGLGLHWLRWLGHGAEIGVANNTIMATHLVVAQDV